MRLIISILLIIVVSSCQKEIIPNIDFYIEEWKSDLVTSEHRFLPKSKCNPGNEKLGNEKGIPMRFPDSFNKSFADINNDGKIDALITFRPVQCDGGRATRNFQFALIILSKEGKYLTIQDTPSLNLGLTGSFFKFQSAQKGKIKAKHFKVREKDGLCCIEKDTIIKLINDKLVY